MRLAIALAITVLLLGTLCVACQRGAAGRADAAPADLASPSGDTSKDGRDGTTTSRDLARGERRSPSCGAPGCATVDCRCQDGSRYSYRTCRTASQAELCSDGCEPFGGAGTPSQAPLLSSTGLRVGASCSGTTDCDQFPVMCGSSVDTSTAALCSSAHVCGDYASASAATCAGAGGVQAPKAGSTGSVLLRSCDRLDWIRFISDATMPTTSTVDGVSPAADGFNAVGRLAGRVVIDAATESCFNSGVYFAHYRFDGTVTSYRAACWPISPDLMVSGETVYTYSYGELLWQGSNLIGYQAIANRTQLVQLDSSWGPAWTRNIDGFAEFVAGATVILAYSDKELTLWNGTTVPAGAVVGITSAGDVAWAKTVTGLDDLRASYAAGYFVLSGYAVTGSFSFDGVSHSTGGPDEYVAALVGEDGSFRWAAKSNIWHIRPTFDGGALVVDPRTGGNPILLRYAPDGKLSWSRDLPPFTTPHLYFKGEYYVPVLRPNGSMVGTVFLGDDESVGIAGVPSSFPHGCELLVDYAADGAPTSAVPFCPCWGPAWTGLIATDTDAVAVGNAEGCNARGWIDTSVPIQASYGATVSGLLLHLRSP